MPRPLDGRVAIVTGGASGIGRAIATALLRAGASVVVADLDSVGGEAFTSSLSVDAARAIFVRTDVTSREEMIRLVERTVTTFGALHIMANIAGAPGRRVDGRLTLLETTDADLMSLVRTNVLSVLIGAQVAAPVMQRIGGGVILNASSCAIDTNGAGLGVYTMTKAAVAMLSKTLAAELGPSGIRVNALAPYITPTSFFDGHFADAAALERHLHTYAKNVPLGRVASAEDTAELAVFLASDAAEFVTGQVLRSNGGATTPW